MALWKSENCLLTLKGEEILNKVSMGVGKLTITRIVTGGSYVPVSQLYKLTSIPEEKQSLTLYDIREDSEGSYVKVEADNSSLQQAYTIYQLGVYVTHPNFEGEVLYWVSQCELDSADFIPLPSELPVNLSFGIFLYNVSTKDITIKIESSTYINKELFTTTLLAYGIGLDVTDDNTLKLLNSAGSTLSSKTFKFITTTEMQEMFTLKNK